MATILVVGAASGLGRAIAKAYAQDSVNRVFAIDRNIPQGDAHLTEAKNVQFLQADITDEAQVEQIAEKFVIQEVTLDLVVHSAGVRGLTKHIPVVKSDDVATADSLEAMDVETMETAFRINTIGTFLLLRALLPSLRRASPSITTFSTPAKKNTIRVDEEGTKSNECVASRPTVAIMGSRMGSIGHNNVIGGAYAYRASKAAMNAVVKSFSVDVPEVTWTIIHPGRVQTGLVAVKEDGALSIDEAVKDLLPLIKKLGVQDSGRFVDRFGNDVPW